MVLELAEQGLLPADVLPLSPELAFRFFTFWNVVAHRRTQPPDIRLPFHYLKSDGFWAAGSIVDAAHIHQFADSRNNDPQNGLALGKNAHWLFDQGLWTIADDYTVIVAVGQFVE